MVRECRRVLIPAAQLAALAPDRVLPLSSEHSRYLTRVLRYGPGDRFAVVDGEGRLWEAELLSRSEARLLQAPDQPLQQAAPPRPALVLVAAVVKRDFEVLVRMAVELGVDRLIPVLCERTAVQGQLRPERWRTIAAEAAEQCERLWLPQLDDPTGIDAAQRMPPEGAACFWATTRLEQLPPLETCLAALPSAVPEVWLACGPEGGWSPAEEEQAAEMGWRAVQLGPTILRSSTAGVAGLARLSGWRAGC